MGAGVGWRRLVGLASIGALGLVGCANVIGLDAYHDGLGDAGAKGDTETLPPPPPPPPRPDAGPAAMDASSPDPDAGGACVPRAGATELLDLSQTETSWHTLHGGSTSIKGAGQSSVTCGGELEVVMNAGDWCGVSQIAPFPLTTSAVHRISIDVTTTTASTSQSLGIQVGSDGHWCQTAFGTLAASSTTTVSFDPSTIMTAPTCLGTVPVDTSTIGGLFIYLNGGGTYFIDDVLVE